MANSGDVVPLKGNSIESSLYNKRHNELSDDGSDWAGPGLDL